jgi:uncharacterized protein (UPF0248 family)
MIPIHQLLSRIRWDEAFGKSQFEFGIYDRIHRSIDRIPFGALRISDSGKEIELVGPDGGIHHVPLHRIREVYRDGLLIWQRPDLASQETDE